MLDLRPLARWAARPPLALHEAVDPVLGQAYAASPKLKPPRSPAPANILDRCDAIASILLDGRRDLDTAPHDPPRCPVPAKADMDGIEALAWYRSWHMHPPTVRAVYLSDWGVHHAAARLDTGGCYRESLRQALILLTAHELFHAAFDLVLTQLEAVLTTQGGVAVALWREYCEHVYSQSPGGGIEESLANAFALRTVAPAAPVRAAAEAWFKRMPGGYARYEEYLADADFRHGIRDLLKAAVGAPYHSGARGTGAPAESLVQQALTIDHLRSVPIFFLITSRAKQALVGTRGGVQINDRQRDRQVSLAQRAVRTATRRQDIFVPECKWSIPRTWASAARHLDGTLSTARLAPSTHDFDGAPPIRVADTKRNAARVEEVSEAWQKFAAVAAMRPAYGDGDVRVKKLLMNALEKFPWPRDEAPDADFAGIRAVVRLA
jgi:hypothetical protein